MTDGLRGVEGGEGLLARARDVRQRAHAPYSRLLVGAALEADDGSVFTGGNVENASYGLSMCAERAAVFAAVAAGRRRFRALAVSSAGERALPPCGACRQVLAEFAPHLPIVSESDREVMQWTLDELLPLPFRGGFLPRGTGA